MAGDLLVSLCNARTACVGIAHVDLATGAAELLDLRPSLALGSFTGVTGLCRLGEGVVAGLQAEHSAIAILDRTLQVVETRRLSLVRDIHSIVAQGDELLIASTGTDQVIAYDLRDGRERVVWAGSAAGADTLHVNALCLHRGRLLASMFGERRPRRVRAGRVIDVASGRALLDGLRHPHSLMSADRALLVLESETGTLVRFDARHHAAPWTQYRGYVRGLCRVGAALVVGRSTPRTQSRLSGMSRHATVAPDWPDGSEALRPALFVHAPGMADRGIDLGDLGDEVYDLLPFQGIAAATMPGPWMRAYASLRQDRPAEAAAILPDTPEPDLAYASLLAQAHTATGEHALAEQALRSVPERDDPTRRQLVGTLMAQARLDEAAAIATAMVQARPTAAALLLLSHCLALQQQWEAAAAALSSALVLQPAVPRLWTQLSRLLARLRQWPEALAASERALQLLPWHAEALVQQAWVLHQLGELSRARACVMLAVELAPEDRLARRVWKDLRKQGQGAALDPQGSGAPLPIT